MQRLVGVGRIPTLDGWRGIAILLVLIDHVQLSCSSRSHPSPLPLPGLGLHGVTIFFVLSGFLITSRLLGEMEASGTIQRLLNTGKHGFPSVLWMSVLPLAMQPTAHFWWPGPATACNS